MTRYELLERIGAGGMAEIFRGKAFAAGGFEKPVAIKRILPHLSEDKRFVELLISEAKILSQLRHRNIVQIYDVGLGEDGQYFLVMEYVDGRDLGAVYDYFEGSGARMPMDVALHLGAEVCEALDHAHRATNVAGQDIRLVHRDVSPSNILLSVSGEIKLTDFGIAKSMEEATGHGGVRGKFAYISPEQAKNIHVDGRSDAYSLAIVAFELVTGKPLFSGLPDLEALTAVREGNVPRLRQVDRGAPQELEDIFAKALAKNPDDRYQSAAELGAALRGFRYTLTATSSDPAKSISNIVIATMDYSESTVIADDFDAMATIAQPAVDFGSMDNEETRAISILGHETGSITLSTRAVPPRRDWIDPEAPTEFAASAEFPIGKRRSKARTVQRQAEAVPFDAYGMQTAKDNRLDELAASMSKMDAANAFDGQPTLELRTNPPMGITTDAPIPPLVMPSAQGDGPARSVFVPPMGHGPLASLRRRPVLVLTVVASLVAVAAFVIAGSLISTPATSADAGIDAVVAQPDAITVAPVDAGPKTAAVNDPGTAKRVDAGEVKEADAGDDAEVDAGVPAIKKSGRNFRKKRFLRRCKKKWTKGCPKKLKPKKSSKSSSQKK